MWAMKRKKEIWKDPMLTVLRNPCNYIELKKNLEKKETKTLIESYKQELSSDGRIFERMSGTEPVLRVMIECDNPEKLDHIGEQISSYFSKFN